MLATHAYAEHLTIDSRTEDGCVTLTVHGEMDLASSQLLRMKLDDAEKSRPRRIVVDLAGVEFMDSTGLYALVRANRRAEYRGHVFALINVSPPVRRLLSLTGGDAVLRIE